MPLRFSLSISLVLIALVACAASASAGTDVAAGISPGLVHRGQQTTISVPTGATKSPCVAILRYQDGNVQQAPGKRPRNHRVSFTVRVPLNAALGAGHWTVLCGASNTQGSFVIVAAKSTTSVDLPRVVVDKQGFTQRPDTTGTGSLLSYGVVLKNTSDSKDARNVYVIVNMVAASGNLIGSKSKTVQLVPAGGTFALGDYMNLRTQVLATHLEITIRVGGNEPKQVRPMPDFANVRIFPSLYDPGWVSEVDGEIVNDTTPLTLTTAALSIVVLDASGNPLGGGTGFATAAIPSDSRFVFLAQIGFTSIPLDRAASVVISAEPTYAAAV
ncbi:MAG: hypothetical protein QOH16_2253 [Gaiellaceae bacterium]|nr:hypothetical protein [Gaiellaceae bacterium]